MMIIRVLPIHVPPCYEGGYLKPLHWNHNMTYDDHLVWPIHVPRRCEPLITPHLSLWDIMRQCKDKGHISHPQEKPQSTSTRGRGGRGSRWVHYIGGGWGGLSNSTSSSKSMICFAFGTQLLDVFGGFISCRYYLAGWMSSNSKIRQTMANMCIKSHRFLCHPYHSWEFHNRIKYQCPGVTAPNGRRFWQVLIYCSQTHTAYLLSSARRSLAIWHPPKPQAPLQTGRWAFAQTSNTIDSCPMQSLQPPLPLPAQLQTLLLSGKPS